MLKNIAKMEKILWHHSSPLISGTVRISENDFYSVVSLPKINGFFRPKNLDTRVKITKILDKSDLFNPSIPGLYTAFHDWT